MREFVKTLGALALVAALVGAGAGTTEAAPVIKISPASTTVGLSTAFSVDIIVEGLDDASDEAVGGFSAELSFDDSLLSGVSYDIDPDDKMGSEVDFSFGFTGASGSPLDLFFIAEAGLDAAALSALQGSSFTLATIHFTSGVLEGLSTLKLSVVGPGGAFLSDADGFEIPAAAEEGKVCVSRDGTPCTVPEPALLSLLATAALTGLASRRRRRS
jgi:hypothetical protein